MADQISYGDATVDNANNSGKILASTLWNQSETIYVNVNGKQTALTGYTYNQYCPTPKADSTSRTLTGCTNTADSQVLYYWIEKGYDFTFTVTTADYFQLNDGSSTLYYVSDTPSLNEGSLTTLNSVLATTDRIANGDFIAALNFYCGVKNHSRYGTEGTSTSWWYGDYTDGKSSAAFVAAGFDSYHLISRGYNSYFYDNSGLTDTAFSVIRENLDYGEIIEVSVPGHAIFLDGYRWNDQTNEYEYHLNYGWGIWASATTWYTVSQLRTTDSESLYAYVKAITFDLSPDIKVNVTNNRNDYWGGSFLRGVERINSIQNEKNTVFAFDESIAGESIELNQTFTVTSAVGLDFQNLNVELSTTAKYLISSSRLLSFELTGGSMTVNASNADTVVVESGNQAVTLSLNNSYVYIGNYAGGISGLNTLLRDDKVSYTDLDSSFYASVSGYALTAGSADDQVRLSNKSAVFGNLSLGGGSNVLSVENGSLFYGDFFAESNSLRTELYIGENESTGPMIVLNSRGSENSFFNAAGGKLNVIFKGLLDQNREYVLFQGTNYGLAQNFTVDLFVGDKKYVLDKTHMSEDNYSLVFENDKISLGYQLSKPEVLSVSADITTLTNKDVTLTAVFSENSKFKYYSFDSQNWLPYNDETGVVLTANATVYFKSTIGDLESDVISFKVDWIDKTPPEKPVITQDITEKTNQTVTLTAVFSADTAVKQYSLDNNTWQDYPDSGVKVEENCTVYFRATDELGNSVVETYEVTNIDKIPPEKPAVSADITTVTNKDVTLTAVYSADTAVKQYSMDGQNWLTYPENGVVVSENGTVYFRAIDEVGNISETTSFEVTNIDKTAPEKPTVTVDITTETNKDVTLTAVYSTDTAVKQYSMDGETWQTYPEGGVIVSENCTVYFRALDEAGNISAVTSYEVTNIVKVVPEAPTVTADITALTNKDVTLTAVYSEELTTKQYSLDGETWQNYPAGGVVVTENRTVYFRGIDTLGTVSKVAQYAVTNIDKVPPEKPAVSADITTLTNKDVTLTAVFSPDAALKQYSKDGKNWQDYPGGGVVVTENCSVYFRAQDEAGNLSDVVRYDVTNIDKTIPDEPSVSADITAITNQDVTLTAVYSAETVTKQYSLDGKKWLSYPENGVIVTENCTVYFRGINAGGTASAVKAFDVKNIDKIPPEQPAVTADITTQTDSEVKLTAVYSADTVTKQYSLDGSNWEPYTGAVVVTENCTVYFRGKDEAGNISDVTSYQVGNIVPKVVPGEPVKVFSSGTLYKTGKALTGVVLAGKSTNSMFVYNGGEARNTNINSAGRMYVSRGGVGMDTKINTQGVLYVSSGGAVSRTMVNNGGKMQVSSGGKAVSTTVNSSGLMYVSRGGSASGTIVSSMGGLYASGGSVINTDIRNGGRVYITSGGYGSGTVLSAGSSYLFVSNGGTAESTTVQSAGRLQVGSGGTLNMADIRGGELQILNQGFASSVGLSAGSIKIAGGSAVQVAIQSGKLYVSSGGTANGVSAGTGAQVYVSNGGKLTGRMTFNAGATVKVTGGTVDFDISEAAPGGAALVNNLALVSGTPAFTITVSAAQADGLYILAAGAAGFRNTVQVSTDSEYLGVLTPDGSSYMMKDVVYTLEVSGSNLQLSVQAYQAPDLNITVNADRTDATSQPVTVSAVFGKDAATREYSLDNRTWQDYTDGIVMEENGTVYFRGRNAEGIYSEVVSYEVTNIDKVAPVINSISGYDVWSEDSIVIIVRASDSGSGVAKTYYTFNGTPWTEFDGSFTVDQNGPFMIKAVDHAGNETLSKVMNVKNLGKTDTDAPVIESISGYDVWSEESVVIIVRTSDIGSGVAKTYYTFNGSPWTEFNGSFTLTENGPFMVKAVDYAGNETVSPRLNVKVIGPDTTGPVISNIRGNDAWNQTTATVTADITDSQSGVAKMYYTFSGSAWTEFDGSFTVDRNGPFMIKAVDNRGNETLSKVMNVKNLGKTDSTAPVIESISGYEAWDPDSVTIKVTVSDTESGPGKTWYTFNGTPWTEFSGSFTITENGPFMIKAQDMVGNETLSKVLNVKNVGKTDTIAPVIESVTWDKTPTSGPVTITAAISDSLSGIDKTYYTFNGTPWTEFSGSFTVTQNGPFMIKAVDKSGNETLSPVRNITNIMASQEAASALCGEELESWNSPLFPAESSPALLLPEAVCGSLTDALAGCDPLTQAGCCPETSDLQKFGNTGSVFSALLSGGF